jgi:hypothetical protein
MTTRRRIPSTNQAYRRWRILFVPMATPVLALVLFASPQASAQENKPAEYRVKAVYLYNFGKFVQWPAGAAPDGSENGFPLCVLGPDPFGATLDEIVKGESIEGQPLVTRRIDRVEGADGCRILFITAMPRERLIMTLQTLQSKPVLTVSDMPDFCNRGGMIQFVLQADKVRFEVNLPPAEKAGLTLSSQLLKVATSVLKSP